MEMIKIKKVNTKKELKLFIQFYYDLYRDNDCAVPYLYSDEMATLRRDKNPSFECCDADYFFGTAVRYVLDGLTSSMTRKCLKRY